MRIIEVSEDALVILLAPAGAGKSTLARRHFRPTEIVSSDRCRALVSDDEGDQSATGPAFVVFDAVVRGRMRMGRLTVADARFAAALAALPEEGYDAVYHLQANEGLRVIRRAAAGSGP